MNPLFQASEKAIKSAMYANGSIQQSTGFFRRNKTKSVLHHDLCDLASRTDDPAIIQLAGKIQGIMGFTGRMRYPDMLPYPKVPHDVYTEEHANGCIVLTERLLHHVRYKYLAGGERRVNGARRDDRGGGDVGGENGEEMMADDLS